MASGAGAAYAMTSEAERLAGMRAWLSAQLADLTPEDRASLLLAVGELCANSIKHAYGGVPGQPIRVTLSREPDRLVIEVEDFGKPFDPDRYVEPDLASMPEHGLGLFLVRASVDETTVDVRREHGTRWTLVKRVPRSEPHGGGPDAASRSAEAPGMNVEITRSGDVVVVALDGDLDTAVAEGTRRQISELIAAGDRRVVVDLARVPYMDSAGLGTLVALVKRAREAGGNIRFAGPQQAVRAIFEMTRLIRILDVHATRADAVATWT